MSKIFDGLLNVYAFAWVLITRSAFGMYACVALMALMLGLFVISFAEQLRLSKKAKEPLPEVVEEAPVVVEEEKPNPKPRRIELPTYSDDVGIAEYAPPAEGTLREENREDGWRHVFVWRAGNWEKSHRISPGGVKVPFIERKPNNRKPLRYCSTATWSRWHVCRGHNCSYSFKY